MEKSTIKALGKILKQELRISEELTFPIKKALQALAELPDIEECPVEAPQKTSNGH